MSLTYSFDISSSESSEKSESSEEVAKVCGDDGGWGCVGLLPVVSGGCLWSVPNHISPSVLSFTSRELFGSGELLVLDMKKNEESLERQKQGRDQIEDSNESKIFGITGLSSSN